MSFIKFVKQGATLTCLDGSTPIMYVYSSGNVLVPCLDGGLGYVGGSAAQMLHRLGADPSWLRYGDAVYGLPAAGRLWKSFYKNDALGAPESRPKKVLQIRAPPKKASGPMPAEPKENGAPKDGSPKDGSPKDGACKDGAPKDGASKDGSPKDGTPKDGASKDDFGDMCIVCLEAERDAVLSCGHTTMCGRCHYVWMFDKARKGKSAPACNLCNAPVDAKLEACSAGCGRPWANGLACGCRLCAVCVLRSWNTKEIAMDCRCCSAPTYSVSSRHVYKSR